MATAKLVRPGPSDFTLGKMSSKASATLTSKAEAQHRLLKERKMLLEAFGFDASRPTDDWFWKPEKVFKTALMTIFEGQLSHASKGNPRHMRSCVISRR